MVFTNVHYKGETWGGEGMLGEVCIDGTPLMAYWKSLLEQEKTQPNRSSWGRFNKSPLCLGMCIPTDDGESQKQKKNFNLASKKFIDTIKI
jgi:hypothetical protein